MESQEFLATVLPSVGNYCAVELSTAKKEHVFVETVEEAYAAAMAFSDRGLEAYFGLASFGNNTRRLAENAGLMRAMFLDIDCNGVKSDKEYSSKTEGAEALDKFLADTGLATLGTPFIVNSGGGLHVYWPLDEDTPITVWKRVAENFKKVCHKFAFKIDFNVPADAARVLRVPDTFNYKKDKPRKVKIMVEASPARFSIDEFEAVLLEHLGTDAVLESSPLLELPGERPKAAPTANSVKLVENSVTLFKNIEEATAAGKGCAQLQYYKDHAAEDGMEPLWFALISLAKRCDDGYAHAAALGALHPYDESRLNDKWNHTKGPTPCVKFDSLNPGVCTGCPHFGKITNPLQLSREVMTVTEASEVTVQVEIAPEVMKPITFQKPVPPKGFSYGKNGGVYIDKVLEDADGTKSTKPVLLLSYDLFVVDILYTGGEHTVHMTAIRNTGAQDILFPQKSIISKDETLKALASQNIVAAFGAGNDKNFFDYVRACVEHSSSNRNPIPVPVSYGWQKDNTFVYNSSIYSPDGSVKYVPTPGLVNINSFCVPTGSADPWLDSIKMLIAREYWGVLTLSLVTPASILMPFSGHSGMVYHIGSSESGTGKSLAQVLAAAFYGHPEKYKIAHSTSAVAAQQRGGLFKNFGVIMDEITAKNRDDFEWLATYLLDKTQGKGKERMESGANKERVNETEWKSMDLFSSNSHVLDFLASRKHSSAGEIMRVLERKLTQVIDLNETEDENIDALKENYGVCGDRFIRWLVQNQDVANDVRKDVKKYLKAEMGYVGNERYWLAGNSCLITLVVLLGSKYANIIDIPVKPIVKELRGMVEDGRAALSGSKRSAEDILNMYTRDNYGKFIIVKKVDGIINATLGALGTIDESITRTQVAGRVEHEFTPNHIDYYIEESQLRQHCSSMSYGYKDLVEHLTQMPNYKITFMKKNMLSKTRGPELRMNVLRITRPVETENAQED
jgi:hypothetical protein